MTAPDLLAKKLAFVETCVADLRRLRLTRAGSRVAASSSATDPL